MNPGAPNLVNQHFRPKIQKLSAEGKPYLTFQGDDSMLRALENKTDLDITVQISPTSILKVTKTKLVDSIFWEGQWLLLTGEFEEIEKC